MVSIVLYRSDRVVLVWLDYFGKFLGDFGLRCIIVLACEVCGLGTGTTICLCDKSLLMITNELICILGIYANR